MPEDRSSHPCLGPWRRRTASGVVLTAVALGLRSAVDEPGDDEAVVVGAPTTCGDPNDPVDLHFDSRGPADSWAVVRPWLVGRGPA